MSPPDARQGMGHEPDPYRFDEDLDFDVDDRGRADTPLSLVLTPESIDALDPGLLPTCPGPVSGIEAASVGRFQLRELLGGGGFGFVYRAYDPRLDREVALKVLREPHPSGRMMERFFREARAASQLDHPNLVAIHDAGRDDARCWISYQYVPGLTLKQLRDRGERPSVDAVARLVVELARGLEHAHGRGVFHRDIKPSNIMIDPTGRARLTDFGLARRVETDATLTVDGAVLGTPAYMSPEAASGRGHMADARSDIYSLGVVLYELLCGVRPADLPSNLPAWRVASLMDGWKEGPRRHDARVPRPLDRVCRRALAREPADRYPDARSLADDLDAWRESRRSGQSWKAAAIGVALGALVCGPIGYGLGSLVSPPTAPEPGMAPSPRPAAAAPVQKPFEPTRIRIQPDRLPVAAHGHAPIYHRPDCVALNGLDDSDLTTFPDPAHARRDGLSPCIVCKPGQAGEKPDPAN